MQLKVLANNFANLWLTSGRQDPVPRRRQERLEHNTWHARSNHVEARGLAFLSARNPRSQAA
jgi:hypothetical protein